MTATITHQTIMLLARDRLDQIDQILGAKERSGLAVEPIDRQIRYLARRAVQFMSTGSPPQVHFPDRPLTTTFGTGVSKYAVFGSLGPDITEFAALMADGQLWARDILHKGTPDRNREAVRARSIDFVLTFWKRADALIAAMPADKQTTVRDDLRAYVLGHMCRIAGDIVVSPYLDDIEWQFGTVLHPAPLSRATIEATLDSVVADRILRSPGTRRGAVWTAWWPTVDDVPPQFYDAFSGAFEDTYLKPSRPLGFAEFETPFTGNLPPSMSPALIKDGYRAYMANLQRGYDWTWGDWVLAMLPLFLPAIAALPFMALLPNAKNLMADAPHDEGKAWAEAFAFPLAATSLVPLIYSIYLTAGSSLGAGTQSIFAIVASSLCVVAGAIFFVTLGTGAPTWVTLVFLFGLPLALEIFYFVWLKLRGGNANTQRLLGWSFMAQSILAVLTTLAFVLFRGWLSKGPGDVLFWVAVLIWGAIVTCLWFLLALALKDNASPEIAADSFATDRRHFVRVFDDTSLFVPTVADGSKLERSFFPSDRRKLLKIWWSGDGEMSIRSRRNSIQFSHDGTDANQQIVLAPIAPMTIKEFASILKRTVKDHAGTVGGLHADIVQAPEGDFELPPGETFADQGDQLPGQPNQAVRDAAANEWRHLGKSVSEREYFIEHAPKLRQSIQFGQNGPVVLDLHRADGAGTGSVAPAAGGGAGPNDMDGAGGTHFGAFFRVGDVIESPNAGPRSTIVKIISDTRITTLTPLGAGGVYNRIVQDRTIDVLGSGQILVIAATPTTVSGVGVTNFASFFMPGDAIQIGTQQRIVTAVSSDSSITVNSDLPPTAATPYYRLASEAGAAGYELVANPAGSISGGDTIMDYAADLAVLLCLGGTTYLLSDDQRRVGGVEGAPAQVEKVVQVFRNWDLDRRRLNEWRMLIAGEAVSEKHGDPTAPDEMIPELPTNWTLRSPKGEPTAAALGWIPLARKWLDVARRPGVSSKDRTSLHPGDPSNLDLSRGMAYLFDMPDPDPAAP